jgi:4-hydroxy-4-methyl-2-oxoglutarate aldolase
MSVNVDPKHIEWLKTVDSPTLSNAIERLRVRPQYSGFAPLQIRCLFPDFGRMCGHAVTAQVETMTETTVIDRSVFMQLYEAVERSPKPAVIAFQEIGPHPDFATHCGEVMATIFKRLGAVGLVSDCAVRDVPEVRAMGFQYFARGMVASHAYFRIVRVSVPIQVCGLPICPGDLLHGDVNGLLSVPKIELEKLPAEVATVRCREGELMEFVRGDGFSLEKLRGRIVE